MPRYFFHVHDGKSIPDHKGVELPDWDAARLHAITVAGRIVADEPQRLGLGEDWTMEVSDENGLVLFKLDFHITASPAVRESKQNHNA